jgi:hypothetical protein
MQTALIIVVFLANACLVGVGIYLSAYLKSKAEALATKEELEDLKAQTAELTRTTKKNRGRNKQRSLESPKTMGNEARSNF